MTPEPHPAVRAVHHAASAVMQHDETRSRGSFWQRLLGRQEHTLYHKVRDFGHALNYLLDVPPMMLSATDIAAIGTEVNDVVKRAEQAIERRDTSGDEPLDAFAPAIYAIRDRYEQIYRRGATGGP